MSDANTKSVLIEKLVNNGIFAVIRMTDSAKLIKVVNAIRLGGVKNIEITLTVPNAVEMINLVQKEFGDDVIVGAGTVITLDDAKSVIQGGGKFIVTPILNTEVIKECNKNFVPIACGSYTPTEIVTAYQAGADIVKVFPATTLGTKYFKDLLGPFPYLKIMPTGGVSIDNVGEWVAAGAYTIAIGSDLLDKKAIAEEKYEILTERAKRMMDNYHAAKQK